MGISQPRKLPLQHLARAIQTSRNGEASDPAPLGPDEMQLYSYYRPGLVAGDYEVAVVHDISADIPVDNPLKPVKTQTLKITNVRQDTSGTLNVEPQRFEVVVPRFTLDPTSINSYYPPDGHQDEGRILPHIVLNDPHYPWEIEAGRSEKLKGPIDGDRNLVPWVALVVFDPDDLRIPTLPEIQALDIPNVTDINQQNVNGTFSMQVKDYFASVPKMSRVDFETGYGADVNLLQEVKGTTDTAQVIFPKKELFKDLFHDCESMKYMAHVRNINTLGFPDAGVEEMGLFSVIISSRTGQFDITKPSTQICHLVSIENFDSTIDEVNTWLDGPNRDGSDRIGIFSLFSWVYTALPPNPINFVDTVENLVRKLQMFRGDQTILATMENELTTMDPSSAKTKATRVLLDRMKMGYTFTRWRPETGEETAAINRGPLVPQKVQRTPPPTSDLPDCSNTSKDFQILDRATGLMDLSYSSAWQLGKTLAISDSVFSAALLRFRSTLYNSTASETRAALNQVLPKADLISNLASSLTHVNNLSGGSTGVPRRLEQGEASNVVTDVSHPDVKPLFEKKLSVNTLTSTSAGETPFNGFNVEPANDNDWVIIHDWLANKLYLSDIPAHYLIPEPSFVPTEAIRFFYIDDFWLDCLIDGALSVANHLNHDDDMVRVEIKKRFNNYLRTVIPDSGIKPQIPGYGFVLRSQIVKTMPDLRITVKWTVDDPQGHERHPVCRYTKYDDTTLICLLDRSPEELDSITLAQPPHQQRFSLGYSLTGSKPAMGNTPAMPGRLEFELKNLYTQDAPWGEWRLSTKQPFMAEKPEDAKSDQTQTWFDWNTRCIQLSRMMPELNAILQRPQSTSGGAYVDATPNSCELALELNDPSYYFTIRPPNMEGKMVPVPTDGSKVVPPDRAIIPRDRQLYINQAADLAKRPIQVTQPVTKAKPVSVMQSVQQPSPPAKFVAQDLSGIPSRPHVQSKAQVFPTALLAMRNTPKPAPSVTAQSQLQSQFTLSVYADYKSVPTPRTKDGFDAKAYIPTKNLFFFDLIFSLVKTIATSKALLLEIQIDIPNEGLDPGGKDPKKEPLLQQGYDGPGVRMIDNQRFIPLLYYDTDHLRVRLIPRTASDSYQFALSDNKSRELSFRLAEANIASVRAGQWVPVQGSGGKPQWRGVASCMLVEIYATPTGPTSVSTPVEVVKWATRDQADVDLEALEQKIVGRT